MKYRPITPEDYEPVRRFLSDVGWQHRVADPEEFVWLLKNTNRTVVAIDGTGVVGFARALCDEVSNGYISMVAVALICEGEASAGDSCGDSSVMMPGSHGCCARGAGAAGSGRRWASGVPRQRWRECGLESKSDLTTACTRPRVSADVVR